MAKRNVWTKDNIVCNMILPDDLSIVHKAQADFVSAIYERILTGISKGKIDKILFSILEDGEFEECFKMTKKEAEKYIQ